MGSLTGANLVIVTFFDTETTGLWNFRADAGHICQPHIVQLAMLTLDMDQPEESRLLHAINVIVKPEKQIEPQAAEIHGITQEKAERVGISRRLAVSMFHHMLKYTDLVVAHNTDFDTRVMRSSYIQEGIQFPDFRTYCTMKSTTDICKIPHANPNRGRNDSYKWPKLIEAYKILVDEEGFDGAHDAMVDVIACSKLFSVLHEKGLVPDYSFVEKAVA